MSVARNAETKRVTSIARAINWSYMWRRLVSYVWLDLLLLFVAAAILIFAASSAFFDTKLYRRPGFRPAVSAGMFLLVQSVYLLHRLAAEVMACFAAAALLAGAAWRRARS